jgi:hypothetical protein
MSSPIRGQIDSVVRGTTTLLAYGEIVVLQLQQSRAQAKAQQMAKTRSRRVVQRSGALTTEEAHLRIAEKEAKIEAQKEKKRQILIRKTRNKIRKQYKALGVTARRQERARIQQLKEFSRAGNSFIPPALQEPIPDPKKALTEENLELQLREALVTFPEFSGIVIPDFTVTTELVLDPRLEFESQQDYIGFENSSDIDEDSEVDISLF